MTVPRTVIMRSVAMQDVPYVDSIENGFNRGVGNATPIYQQCGLRPLALQKKSHDANGKNYMNTTGKEKS